MGKCLYHGQECEVLGEEDEILLCESCFEEMQKSVFIFCAHCGSASFVEPQIVRESVFGDNPERPEVQEWLAELPVLIITEGCSDCLIDSERAIGVHVFSRFTLKKGRLLL